MNVQVELQSLFSEALQTLGFSDVDIQLQHPSDMSHGDYTVNVAMQLAKGAGQPPRQIADAIVAHIVTVQPAWIAHLEVAGPGFINLTFTPDFFAQQLAQIDANFGRNQTLSGKKAVVEYTDPNPFKVLHIGHLMSNTVGESISRIVEWSGAEMKRACYQGDVGMHVAKSLWGLMNAQGDMLPEGADLSAQVAYLGRAYARGAAAYTEEQPADQAAIKELNKQVYERSDVRVNELYDWGRQVSLDYFETQYKTFGTHFDFYFFESQVWPLGTELVREYLKQGVFVESQGAIVFPGEDHGLHTRVFINSEGLPTYEAKELGLAKLKYDAYPYDLSVVVTSNEVNEYFAVLLKALSLVFPELASKTVHLGHGTLRLPTGKMSSRTGTIIAAEDLIAETIENVTARSEHPLDDVTKTQIAIAAIKYSILKQTAGKDIIFDFATSLSFEGDSGPYLQYAYVRCQSVLRKSFLANLLASPELPVSWQTTDIERLIYRFPEVVQKSCTDFSSHHVASFLIDLARAFHSWYGSTKIVDVADPSAPYKLALVTATAQTLKSGLWLLGIEAPEKM